MGREAPTPKFSCGTPVSTEIWAFKVLNQRKGMLAALKTWSVGRVGKGIRYKEKGEGSIPVSIIFLPFFELM